jgi:hypothetical protein
VNSITEFLGLCAEEAYESWSKKQEQELNRKRKMPFRKLMWYMLRMVKESSQMRENGFSLS